MQGELTLYDYWRIINRRKWIALLVFSAVMISVMLYTRQQPVVYKSQAIIKFQPPASYSKIPGSDITEWDPWSVVSTEIRVIKSIEIAEKAAERAGALSDTHDLSARNRIVRAFLGSYGAERVEGANLINIYAHAPDPYKAAEIINSVIEAYKIYDFEQKSRQAKKTLEDIFARKSEVEDNLHSLERVKQDFLKKNPRTGLWAALASQLADFEIRKKELLEKYTPSHPEVVSIEQRIQVIQSKLSELPAQETELVRITRELRMQEDLYTTLNREHEQAKLGFASIVSFVSVINPPFPETRPISPNKKLNFFVGILLGAFLSVLLIFLLENLDVSISTIEDIESFLKLPVLGIIPNIMSEKHIDNWLVQIFKKERYTTEAFRSALIFNKRYASNVIEAYHTLRTNILSQIGAKGPVSIILSSAGAAEGKTLTAVNFSLAAAHSGLRTLLVDADARRPAIYDIFGLDKEPGLTDILAGKILWEDAVKESSDFIIGGIGLDRLGHFTGIDNLKIITCGTIPNNVVDLLDSANWEEVMDDWKTEFDMIIFDAPPVLLFVDAVITAKYTDGVVLVYKAGKIARGALKRATEQIQNVNARMIGVVLNGVRASEMGPQYGYYYYDYKRYARK